RTDDAASQPFSFEVGRRVSATRAVAVRPGASGLEILLETDAGNAIVTATSEVPGTVRLQLRVDTEAGFSGGLDTDHEVGGLIFRAGTTLDVRRSGTSDWQVRQPLGLSWTRL